MVGGIYTVLSTKMDEMKRLFGDNYISIGPDLVKESHETLYLLKITVCSLNGENVPSLRDLKYASVDGNCQVNL